MIIVEHVPAFMDGFKARSGEFSNLDGLLAIDWVRSRMKEPSFLRFSLADTHYLMAEYISGDWVVGRLDGVVDLPVWRGMCS